MGAGAGNALGAGCAWLWWAAQGDLPDQPLGGAEIFFPKNPEGTARVLFSAVLHRIPQSIVVVY